MVKLTLIICMSVCLCLFFFLLDYKSLKLNKETIGPRVEPSYNRDSVIASLSKNVPILGECHAPFLGLDFHQSRKPCESQVGIFM